MTRSRSPLPKLSPLTPDNYLAGAERCPRCGVRAPAVTAEPCPYAREIRQTIEPYRCFAPPTSLATLANPHKDSFNMKAPTKAKSPSRAALRLAGILGRMAGRNAEHNARRIDRLVLRERKRCLALLVHSIDAHDWSYGKNLTYEEARTACAEIEAGIRV